MTHLLVLATVAALFLAAMGNANLAWLNVSRLLAWMGFGALAIYAFATNGRRRVIAISGLFLGLSYLYLAREPIFATFDWMEQAHSWVNKERGPPFRNHFVEISRFALSFAFALLGAALGAYWSRPPKGK